MSDVMLPCPYCGKSDRLKVVAYRADDDGESPFDWGFMAQCSARGFDGDPLRGCGSSSGWGETREDAIAAWNRRSALSPTKQEETPVAWRYRFNSWAPGVYNLHETKPFEADECFPLYASSPSVSREAGTRQKLARALWLQSAHFPTKAAHWDTPGEMLDADKQPYFDLADAALDCLAAPEHGERTI